MKISEAVARAFVQEGVTTHFGLLGDGNLHWAMAMQDQAGTRLIHARHEHCAVAMAAGYASATGRVGVASVTCGPGFTQLMTALVSAAQNRVPMVVLAGESPISKRWHVQQIDQRPFATASGADYISVHSPDMVHFHVQEAFFRAKQERRPVVLGIPYDVQERELPTIAPYETSAAILPELTPIPPDPARIAELAAKLAGARCPLIIAGRGVLTAGAEREVEMLAEATGALLGTTLPARGAFDKNPYSLGVIGGYARMIAREYAAKADLVVAFGASLSAYTTAGGKMFADAEIVQVDTNPVGRRQGFRVAGSYLRADAKLAAAALIEALGRATPVRSQVRSPELARRIRDEPADDGVFPRTPGLVDPRELFRALERLIPGDYDAIGGSGHQAYFHTVMRGGDPRRYHSLRDFGAIGNAFPHAIGVAAARGNNGRVVLYEGDGSLLMHIQELECIRRHGLKLLIVICNDGAYGAEQQDLRREGLDDSIAVFGRPDLAAIARGFGLRGATVTDVAQLDDLARDYERGDTAAIWDVHVDEAVMNPSYRLGNKHN
ncbi:thiamine pyrophosphate-binding protein [Enterovirga sp.]|uniref:thiamine pyrophosphate-binding protein n=1 Tax=Enterovirga sp. TaxID=2026350 RepID=UPI002637B5BA|nr:thiamine pyrophosphate-binding protein [Enterovirga sp.]MDB5592989.1 thiamine pyrophosphate-binding protein [Enterovirga sp.]